ncbi:MAG: hypothetical protein V1909_04050 [Candidatus Micrarchaeota archaeon]
MRVAIGTAITLGLMKGKMESSPTTAHFLIGEECAHSCAYCSARNSTIARIEWPEFSLEEVLALPFTKFKRACLQLTSTGLEEAISLISKIPVPVSVTFRAESESEIKSLFSAGADRVCTPLDACTLEISEKVFRGGFVKQLGLLEWAGKEFPGKIATHIIIGLGERERDSAELLKRLWSFGVYAGLFAFTPAKGSALAGMEKPHLGAYRRNQIARYLVMKGQTEFSYNLPGQLVGLPKVPAEAFKTSGCPGCNRPYFDGSPSKPYNYPRELTSKEYEEALKQAKIYEGKSVYKAQKLIKIGIEYSDKIESIKITGDFFVYPEDGLGKIEKNLVSCPVEKEKIQKNIAKTLNEFEAFGFDANSLADAIIAAAQ